jgi:hypothetical protein
MDYITPIFVGILVATKSARLFDNSFTKGQLFQDRVRLFAALTSRRGSVTISSTSSMTGYLSAASCLPGLSLSSDAQLLEAFPRSTISLQRRAMVVIPIHESHSFSLDLLHRLFTCLTPFLFVVPLSKHSPSRYHPCYHFDFGSNC